MRYPTNFLVRHLITLEVPQQYMHSFISNVRPQLFKHMLKSQTHSTVTHSYIYIFNIV